MSHVRMNLFLSFNSSKFQLWSIVIQQMGISDWTWICPTRMQEKDPNMRSVKPFYYLNLKRKEKVVAVVDEEHCSAHVKHTYTSLLSISMATNNKLSTTTGSTIPLKDHYTLLTSIKYQNCSPSEGHIGQFKFRTN